MATTDAATPAPDSERRWRSEAACVFFPLLVVGGSGAEPPTARRGTSASRRRRRGRAPTLACVRRRLTPLFGGRATSRGRWRRERTCLV